MKKQVSAAVILLFALFSAVSLVAAAATDNDMNDFPSQTTRGQRNLKGMMMSKSSTTPTAVSAPSPPSSGSGGSMSMSSKSGSSTMGSKSMMSSKSSSSSMASGSLCECLGSVEYQFLTSDTIFELAAARLGTTLPAETSLDLVYSLAVTLAPPNCYLASAATDFEERRLQYVPGVTGVGFVGAFKEIQTAYDDRGEFHVEDRRMDWFFLDGANVDADLWAPEQPPRVTSNDPNLTPSIGVYDQDVAGLLGEPLNFVADGAYYKCCSAVLPDCYKRHPTDVEAILLPAILASETR